MDVRSSYLTVGLSFSLRHVTDGDPILLGRHGMPGRDACNCDGGSRQRMRRPPFRNEEKIPEGEYCTTKRGSGKPASAQSISFRGRRDGGLPARKGAAEFLHRHVLAGSRRCGGCRGRCGHGVGPTSLLHAMRHLSTNLCHLHTAHVGAWVAMLIFAFKGPVSGLPSATGSLPPLVLTCFCLLRY